MDTLHRDDPAGLLAATEGLRARARTRLRGAGVPLLGFGLLALAAVPIAREAYNFGATGRTITSYPAFAYAEYNHLCVQHGALDSPCVTSDFDGAILRFLAWGVWFVLLPLAWFALARWYRRRGEARGIVPHRSAWLGATAATAVVLTAVVLTLAFADRVPFSLSLLGNDYASPWYMVDIGLLVLGFTERSPLVAGTGLVHAVLLTVLLGESSGGSWLPWLDGPRSKALLLAGLLLVAGLAQWAAERRTPAVSRTVTP
ncbi:hypothetical protein [Kitasatospora purpeofusca]|uniref:hypothetical protein n=1 Tax=Kitasatospora purpeofusca TaxID=67352 RepID=UPI00068E71AF|nr:hypothetical protein [Kitasatospora purpeofusca]